MKPALYWTIRQAYWQSGRRVYAVTSEGRQRVNGRQEPDGQPTHWRAGDNLGRFMRPEDAQAALAKLGEVVKPFDDELKALNETERGVHAARRKAVDEFVKGWPQ